MGANACPSKLFENRIANSETYEAEEKPLQCEISHQAHLYDMYHVYETDQQTLLC